MGEIELRGVQKRGFDESIPSYPGGYGWGEMSELCGGRIFFVALVLVRTKLW